MRRLTSTSSTALAALLAALVLLTLLGHKPLTDWDEGIYAEVSREMLLSGWLIPHWSLQPWFEKPPLEMWITAAFFKLFGISEFTARACSALSGVAIVALLHRWLARKRDLLAAWLCTVILLSTFGFLHVARVGETDVLLSLGCIIALIGLTEVDERKPTGWHLFWTGFAVAAMAKGAAAVTLPVTAIAVVCLPTRKPGPAIGSRFGSAFWLGLAIFLLLVLPWHLYLWHLFGHRFFDDYLGWQVITRATRQIEEHVTPWWFYFKVIVVSAPLLALLSPFAVGHALRHAANGSGKGGEFRAWAVFCLITFACFTLAQTRLPQYIAPTYPALALLTAVFVEDWHRPALRGTPVSYPIKLALAATVACAVAYLLTSPARKSLHSVAVAHGPESENKDSIALLREAFRHPQPVPGPILLWRQGRIMSITTDMFYSRRQVQQVQLEVPPGTVPDPPYGFDPRPLSDEVRRQPRLILLDKSLVPQLPADYLYTPIESNKSMQLGEIARKP